MREPRQPNRLSARDQADQQRVEQGVTLLQDETALEPAYRQLQQTDFGMFGLARRTEYLLEAFADGREFSVELALVDGTVRFSGVTEKWVTSPPSFVEIGHVFPRASRAATSLDAGSTQALGRIPAYFTSSCAGLRLARALSRPTRAPVAITSQRTSARNRHRSVQAPPASAAGRFRNNAPARNAAAAVGFRCPVRRRAGSARRLGRRHRRDYVVHCGLEKQPGTAFVHPKAPLTGSHSLS